jgi:TPP-dependent indolepyruvate ferredoxin oxidoreductase alpha subunit
VIVVEMNMGQIIHQVRAAVDHPDRVYLANRVDGSLITPFDIKNVFRVIQGKGYEMPVTDYLRKRSCPNIWCPGCGNGTVLNCLLRAVEKLGIEKNDIVMVTGIGCSARMEGYVDFHTLHTIHGRALAFATGVKLARPELKILVPMGDGDALAIGGTTSSTRPGGISTSPP